MKAIDLFAGLGGFTEGARLAGVPVVWAANHWQAACDWHHRNHPEVRPECQDLQQANWETLPPFDLGLGSPCCQGHSKAKGTGRPHHDASRATAWAIVTCCEYHRPAVFIVENVPEFLRWELYPIWSAAMERLGYALAPHLSDAADHGVPQHRQRIFIVCTRSRAPLRLTLPRRDHIAARTVLDFSRRGHAVSRLCANTRQRVKVGRARHGREFMMAYYGNEKGGRSLDRPIGTITTRDRWALIQDRSLRMLTAAECRAFMGFRADYGLPPSHRLAVHLLGNAVSPPQAADIITAVKAAA